MQKKFIIFILISLFCHTAMADEQKTDSHFHRIKIDHSAPIVNALEDMFYPEDGKYEIGYTYSSIAPANTFFPLGIYGEWSDMWVAVSAEIAANVSNERYTLEQKKDAMYDPIFYSMLGLGVNFNVLSINFSAGILDYKYGATRTVGSFYVTSLSHKIAAILQPSIHIHIPVDDFEHFISLKVGYNICPSMSEFNGLNIGIGFGLWY